MTKNTGLTTLAAALLALLAVPGLAKEEAPLPKDLPPFGPDRPMPVPSIVEMKTPEGLTVWIVPRRGLPKVTAALTSRGGTAADPKGLEGVASLLAETVRSGTPTRNARRIAEELQAVGGELYSVALDDAVRVGGFCLSKEGGVDTLLDVLSDVVRNAAYPKGEVDLAKANALDNLAQQESTPEFLGNDVFASALFGSHPYRITHASREVIAAVTEEKLRREHARRFRPERSLLVVAGDLSAEKVKAIVTRTFGGWKATGEAAPGTADAPPAPRRRILLVDRPDSVQSHILVGAQALRATEPDYHALILADTIYGGAFSSRLVRNIREDKGYTYSPGSSLTVYERGGVHETQADVRSEVTGASLAEIFYEMDRMATTDVTDEELSRGKRAEGGLYLLRNQSQGAVASLLAQAWVRGLPPGTLAEYVPKLSAVTKADVRRVSRRFLASARQTIVVVGEAAKVKDELAVFGEVELVKR